MMNYKISGRPVSPERWNKTLDDHPEGAAELGRGRMPIFSSGFGGLNLVWSSDEEPRNVAAAFVDTILGDPGPHQKELNESSRRMGPYESALWKLELEVGGDLLRIIEPVLDSNPGEVRRVLQEAFPQAGK